MIKKKDDKSAIIMYNVIERIRHIAIALNPFLPETSEKIFATLGLNIEEELSKDFKENKKFGLLNNKLKVKKGDVLFPRLA
jgi:methionyl-tRNA synthetase